ncbi:MAG: hypothetical protein ACYDCK_06025, partial [Thermoplasmatota archaeon]
AHAEVDNAGSAALPGQVDFRVYPLGGNSTPALAGSSGPTTLALGATTADATVTGAGLFPEPYIVRATTHYNWTDAAGTHTGVFSRWAPFDVRGVRVTPTFTLPGTVAHTKTANAVVTLKNIGNEHGHNITATLAIPLDYAIQPKAPTTAQVLADPAKLWGIANPPPASANIDHANHTLVLTWTGIGLDAGQTFSSTLTLVALAPQTNTFVLGTSWLDTVDVAGAAQATTTQVVT